MVEARKSATLTSLKNGTLLRVNQDAPPLPDTEAEVKACAAKLHTYNEDADEEEIEIKDLAAYIRTQVGWFNYQPE